MGKWLEKFSAKIPLPPTATLDRLSIASSVSVRGMPVFPKFEVWTTDDWLYFYNERAGILEHDGRHTQQEAERIAYETCVVRWMNENPPVTNPDICPQCSLPIIMQANNATTVLKKGGHILLHDKCHTGWLVRRRQDAMAALNKIGIIA